MKVKDLLKTDQKRSLEFSPNLYLGEGIRPRQLDKLKKKLLHEPLLANVCLLTLSESEDDQLDIIPSWQLAQPVYGSYPLKVAGLAASREEAMDLVVKITEDCLASRRDCAIKEFLTWR